MHRRALHPSAQRHSRWSKRRGLLCFVRHRVKRNLHPMAQHRHHCPRPHREDGTLRFRYEHNLQQCSCQRCRRRRRCNRGQPRCIGSCCRMCQPVLRRSLRCRSRRRRNEVQCHLYTRPRGSSGAGRRPADASHWTEGAGHAAVVREAIAVVASLSGVENAVAAAVLGEGFRGAEPWIATCDEHAS